MGGVYSDNCENLNTTNMLQELILCYQGRTDPTKVADVRIECIKNIKEHFPYFELGVEQDAMYKPLSKKQ